MTTAAEKFDLVPPWCTVMKGDIEWCVESHDKTHLHGETSGWWREPEIRGGYIRTEPEARRIARLTRPLDSWEPGADCPLPDGVTVQCLGDRMWFVFVNGVKASSNFDTRRAAIVWAWKEAPAPADAKPRPITEADVKVGAVFQDDDGTGDTFTIAGVDPRLSVSLNGARAFFWHTGKSGFVESRNGCNARIITDGPGATDGQSDDRGTLDWAAFDELCKTVDDVDTRAVDGAEALGTRATRIEECVAANEMAINALDDRIGAVETKVEDMADVLARICPEADSQTDGKGRTLVQINREIDAQIERINFIDRLAKDANTAATDACDTVNALKARVEADATANRNVDLGVEHRLKLLENAVKRLSAAQVAKPATLNTRSDDASTNEVMTEAAAVDDGWREMLVPRCLKGDTSRIWWRTPDNKYGMVSCSNPHLGWGKLDNGPSLLVIPELVTDASLKARAELPPPPNLAEWYKPKAAAFRDTAAVNADTLKDYDAACAAVPSTYRVGDDLAAWVRHLAAAHERAVVEQERYRQTLATCDEHMGTLRKQLADANTAAVAAEGRAATAVTRASKAEEELADLRGKVENLRAAFAG